MVRFAEETNAGNLFPMTDHINHILKLIAIKPSTCCDYHRVRLTSFDLMCEEGLTSIINELEEMLIDGNHAYIHADDGYRYKSLGCKQAFSLQLNSRKQFTKLMCIGR